MSGNFAGRAFELASAFELNNESDTSFEIVSNFDAMSVKSTSDSGASESESSFELDVVQECSDDECAVSSEAPESQETEGSESRFDATKDEEDCDEESAESSEAQETEGEEPSFDSSEDQEDSEDETETSEDQDDSSESSFNTTSCHRVSPRHSVVREAYLQLKKRYNELTKEYLDSMETEQEKQETVEQLKRESERTKKYVMQLSELNEQGNSKSNKTEMAILENFLDKLVDEHKNERKEYEKNLEKKDRQIDELLKLWDWEMDYNSDSTDTDSLTDEPRVCENLKMALSGRWIYIDSKKSPNFVLPAKFVYWLNQTLIYELRDTTFLSKILMKDCEIEEFRTDLWRKLEISPVYQVHTYVKGNSLITEEIFRGIDKTRKIERFVEGGKLHIRMEEGDESAIYRFKKIF